MCNILILEKGQMIDREKFVRMCYNNWHSWGLVTKVGDKLDIKRSVPESGEIDPEEVWAALEKDIEYQRFLHVRHTTAGVTDLDNCHPFDVYYNPKTGRQVVFMHNGTLHTFKSKKPSETGSTWVDDDSGPSDTKNFTDQVLIPFIAQADYGRGYGDLTSPQIKQLLGRFWMTGNRGLLISSKDPYLLLGRSEWKEIKLEDDSIVWSANDLYFDRVSRGPEYERRQEAEKVRLRLEEEERKAKQAGAQETTSSGTPEIVKLADVVQRVGENHPHFKLNEKVSRILEDMDLFDDDRSGRAALGLMTDQELLELYEDKDTCIWLMNYMFSDYATLLEEFEDVCDDKEKAQLVIIALKRKLQELEGNTKGVKVG